VQSPNAGRRSADRRIPTMTPCGYEHGRARFDGALAFRRSTAVRRRELPLDSASAALPGDTGCKREDPLRHQYSEHLAIHHAMDGLIPKPPAARARPPACENRAAPFQGSSLETSLMDRHRTCIYIGDNNPITSPLQRQDARPAEIPQDKDLPEKEPPPMQL
jgi:hypothetical protein